jgi:hypothetical protein
MYPVMLRQLATGHIGQLIAEAGEAGRRRPARFRRWAGKQLAVT